MSYLHSVQSDSEALPKKDAPGAVQAVEVQTWGSSLLARLGPHFPRTALLKNAAVLAATSSTLLVLSKRFRGQPLGYDEQFFVWGGWSILKGLVPYRDFLEHKPPLAFLTHAVGLLLFGFENHRYRIFFELLLLFAIFTWQLALLSRKVDRVVAGALGIGLVYLFTNSYFHDSALDDTESIGLAYYFFGLGFFLFANTRRRRLLDALGGAFLAASVLSKEPFALSVLPTWLTLLVCRHRTYGMASARAFVRDTTIGVAVVIVSCCLYMIPTGAMTHYLAMVGRYRAMWRDPTKSYCAVLGRFRAKGSLLEDLPAQWEVVKAGFFNPTRLGFLVGPFLAAIVFVGARSKAVLALACITLAAGLYATTLNNCFWPHYYILAMPGIFFFLSLGLIAMSNHVSLRNRPVRTWVWLVMAMPLFYEAWPLIKTEYRSSYPSQPDQEPIAGVFDFVRANTTPEDRIFTTGPPGLYVLTDRVSATRTSSISDEIIDSFPGQTDTEKTHHLYEDLAEHRPKLVIMDPENAHRKVRYVTMAVMPFLQDFKYQKVSDYFYLRP